MIFEDNPNKIEIKKEDILAAQRRWAAGVISIGIVKPDPKRCTQITNRFVDETYAFDEGNVLVKPTLAKEQQFRTTKEGTISYLIGKSSKFPEDRGFALLRWTEILFENAGFIFDGNRAIAMGNYFFKRRNGYVAKVEYTFGYVKLENGSVKITFHHSSLPFEKL